MATLRDFALALGLPVLAAACAAPPRAVVLRAPAAAPAPVRVAAPAASPLARIAPAQAKTMAITAIPHPSPAAPDRQSLPAAAELAKPATCKLDDDKRPPGFYPLDAVTRGQVALTFDDGPHPGFTPHVLDLLAKQHMKATFFLVGHNISRDTYPIIQRMIAEGHALGSHTYNHDVGMAKRDYGKRSVEYIRGEHETTRILIQIAVLAESPEDFDRMFQRVFEQKSGTYLDAHSLRVAWPAYVARFAGVLAERGYTGGEMPYPVVYSRPPAGTPYLGLSDAAHRHLYDAALAQLGLLNVMWNGESGDATPRKHDYGFLTGNIGFYSRRGGILLIHDYIRRDALAAGLARMAADKAVHVVPLAELVEERFACRPAAVLAALQAGHAERAKVASTDRAAH